MTITRERDGSAALLYELTAPDRDYQSMLSLRNLTVRSGDLTGTLVAEDWLVRHGFMPSERRTCGACLTWSAGHNHDQHPGRSRIR